MADVVDSAAHREDDQKSVWHSIKEGYESLVETVIRPMRAMYRMEDLGPSPCMIGDSAFARQDIQLTNAGGYTLECSWWRPHKEMTKNAKSKPCIVVLHGNSSCRLGCMDMMSHALSSGFTVFALDFCGSGLSQGKYVSLGYHESFDIDAVTAYLRSTGIVSHIVLWGRSMGAVSALLCVQRDPSLISAMVLDCPFAKLSQLANELVDDGKLNVPKIAVKIVMFMVRRSVKKRAKFDMYKLKPVTKIHHCTIPTFFGVAKHDELIPPRHGMMLYEKHNGPKKLMSFDGGHNCARPSKFYDSAIEFVASELGLAHTCRDAAAAAAAVDPRRLQEINPLSEGIGVDQIPFMSVRELQAAVQRAGRSSAGCVEKSDLVALVKELFAQYQDRTLHGIFDQESQDTPENLPEPSRDLNPSL